MQEASRALGQAGEHSRDCGRFLSRRKVLARRKTKGFVSSTAFLSVYTLHRRNCPSTSATVLPTPLQALDSSAVRTHRHERTHARACARARTKPTMHDRGRAGVQRTRMAFRKFVCGICLEQLIVLLEQLGEVGAPLCKLRQKLREGRYQGHQHKPAQIRILPPILSLCCEQVWRTRFGIPGVPGTRARLRIPRAPWRYPWTPDQGPRTNVPVPILVTWCPWEPESGTPHPRWDT